MGPLNTKNPVKILIADDNHTFAYQAAQTLENAGFSVKITLSGKEASNLLLSWKPRILIANLLLPETNALELLQKLKKNRKEYDLDTQLIVVSSHNHANNVIQTLKQGAVDYIIKPITYPELVQRVVLQLHRHKKVSPQKNWQHQDSSASAFLFYLTELMVKLASQEKNINKALFHITNMIASKMDGIRCNLVQLQPLQTGIILCSSDNFEARGIKIDLNKYPEILSCIGTKETQIIDDISKDPHLAQWASHLNDIQFQGLIIAPLIESHGNVFGVLSLKLLESRKPVSNSEIRFITIASHLISSLIQEKSGFPIVDIQSKSQEAS